MAKKILLADDSLTIQKVVELTFSDSEYDLLCVPNGQRALEKVAEESPDLILADVVMPEKNGYEVCEAIKANPATARSCCGRSRRCWRGPRRTCPRRPRSPYRS